MSGWLVAAVAGALLAYIRITAPTGGFEATPVTPGDAPLLTGDCRVVGYGDADNFYVSTEAVRRR